MNVLQLSLVLFVIALCNSLVQSAVVTSESEEYGVFTYPPTRECSLAGGICVHDADCLPGETTSQKNLCKAHGDDIQCCYALAPGKASCAQQGGQCTDQCSGLVRSELTECDNVGQQCCVYTF